MLTLVIAGTLCIAFNIAPALAQEGSTLYIYDDYTFTDVIYEPIVVCADNIVIDGNGYTLQGPGPWVWPPTYGFRLSGRKGVTIKNVVIEGWVYGICAGGSDGNTLSDNTISGNLLGVYLEFCDSNTLSDNTMSDNWSKGILAFACEDNTLSGNKISSNYIGIELSSLCHHNLIYHNNILDNELTQAIDIMADNYWHHPDLLEGNYWSDYPGVDDGSGTGKHAIAGDLIGDTDIPWPEPYMDNYPLMLTWITDPVEETQELIETIESWNFPKGAENCLTSKLDGAIRLLNMGNVNGAIHKLGDFIKQVENNRKDLTEEQRSELIQTAQAIIFSMS